MRIILIEDEHKFAQSLLQGLCEAGFSVDWHMSGMSALDALRKTDYALVILDLRLPDISGWQVLERLRQKTTVPVVILSASDGDEYIRRAREFGVGEYLVKPVSFPQLLTTIYCLAGSGLVAGEKLLLVGELLIDTVVAEVTRAGKTIKLARREHELLLLLAEFLGKVLPHQFICQRIWGMSFDADQLVVERAARKLKEKLDDGFPSELIRIVPGMGYALAKME